MFCRICNSEKSESDFYERKDGLLGYHTACKSCMLENQKFRDAEAREHKTEKMRLWCQSPKNANDRKMKYLFKNLFVKYRDNNENIFSEELGYDGRAIFIHLVNELNIMNEVLDTNFRFDEVSTEILHIDHIVPLKYFKLAEAKECWRLENIQILPAHMNKSFLDKMKMSNRDILKEKQNESTL